MKKNLIVFWAALLIIFVPIVYAQQYDSQSVSSHYNQYSADSLNSSNSQYESQYSPKNISNPYSQFEVQYSPKNVSNFSAQEEHDYHANIVSPPAPKQEAKAIKESPESAWAAGLFDNTKPKKSIPVFFYLLAISSLAVGATIFIIIGIFKK